jgi:hypothetical protein
VLEKGTAGPSTSLRFGRDDNLFVTLASHDEPRLSGMKKGRESASIWIWCLRREQQVPPLRFASVGMTIYL